ncbi:MAG: hypothetical protein Q4E53_03420 [Eubacteriales bacterium]|nr:hypothetical protein [Eubacteriales bacterium]
MKGFVKKAFAAVMVMALAVGMMTGCSTSKDLKTQNGNKVLFTYDNTEATLKEAWIYAKMEAEQYNSYYGMMYGSDFWLSPMGMDAEGKSITFESYVKQQIINKMKMIMVLNNKAEELGISLTEEEKTECADFAKKFAETEQGAAILKECGAGESDMAKIYEQNKIASKVQQKEVEDVDTEVSDDEARVTTISRIVYKTTKTDDDGNTVDMTDAEKAETLKKAELDLKKIQDGTELAKVAEAAEFTNTSESYGAGQSEEGEAFEKKIAGMKDGDLMGEVMECANGYVIAQLNAYTDAEATKTSKENIVAQRQQDAFAQIYQEWIKDLEADWDYAKSVDQALWDEVVLHSEESTATDAVEETAPAEDTSAAEATTAAK